LWNFGLLLSKFGCHDNCLGALEVLDSIFEFADPENLTILAKKSSISCAELKSVQFWFILAKFGCHGNSIGSFEILYTIFEFADPENPSDTHKIVSISCTQMKLCLFECLAYIFTIAGIGNFLDFCEK